MAFRAFRRLAVLITITILCLAALSQLRAADPPAAQPALAPQESLKQIVTESGLVVELVANEPNVIDPVAIRFDEGGRLWVVEMREYPTGPTKEFPAGSRISILRDKNGDGFYESATVFADNLSFATGLQPWKGGVFVTMAGKVAYMKDTNGDDKADVNETWYTGFSQLNPQLRANHPKLALDNHIYVAGGLRGGTIVDPRYSKLKPVSINGMDFRFDPRSRAFEAITGGAQFGLSFDDYGNRFACANRDPATHVVFEDRQLKKNPLVAVDKVLVDVVYGSSTTPVYPLGRTWTTSHEHAGQFTSACGVTIFRGDGLRPEDYGQLFTCEPTGYLVHREKIKPSGVTFSESFANNPVEFFASRDEWTRPVYLEIGPDGALYVVDMYRQVIDHPEFMPEELRDRPNLRAGNDRGRIYRVVAADVGRRPPTKLAGQSSDALVKSLASPNSWTRETAQRLLLERQDKSIGKKLRAMALGSSSAPARIQALWLLEGLRLVDDLLLLRLCDDVNPRIVEQAIIISDSRVGKSAKLRERIARLALSEDARVRFQALLVALPVPTPPKYPLDCWEEHAMLIAAGNRGGTALKNLLADPNAVRSNVANPEQFIARLAGLAAASNDERQPLIALEALVGTADFERAGLIGLLTGATRDGAPPADLLSKASEPAQVTLNDAFQTAREDAGDTERPEAARCEAIDLLAFSDNSAEFLLPLAVGDPSQPVRLRAVAALTRVSDLEPWRQLLSHFTKESPAMKRAILDGVLVSAERTTLILDAMDAGEIKPTVFDPVRSKMLRAHHDSAIRARAEKLLASTVNADREKVLAEYLPALQMKGDAHHGREIFEKRCAVCHRIDTIGVALGPDISDAVDRTPLRLLTDILQPNRAIDANYSSYTAVTTDGRIYNGVLATETSTSITLNQQEGKSDTLRRDEIEDLYSEGVSYMPEGLEKDLSLQDMADLILFVRTWRYLDAPPEYAPAAK